MDCNLPTLLIYAPGREFVVPYIERDLPGTTLRLLAGDELEHEDNSGAPAIMLSGTEIYKATQGTALDEDTPVDNTSPMAAAETAFTAFCNRKGAPPIVLRCANTVGTGMQGYVRRLAEAVYRGFFYHFADNDSRLSVVHACDVAAVVKALLTKPEAHGSGLTLNVTDGEDPTLHNLVEALAFRMKQKRVSTLSTRWQQWACAILYGRARMQRLTSTLTFDGSRVRRLTGTEPVSVTEYLRNHIYDDSSL